MCSAFHCVYCFCMTMLQRCLLIFFICASGFAQQPSCKKRNVEYKRPEAQFVRNVEILPLSKELLEGNDIRSTQGTREVRESTFQAVRAGSYESTLQVVDVPTRKEIAEIKIANLNAVPQLRWINEKLLFVQIWWGTFASSDLIVNVDTKQ